MALAEDRYSPRNDWKLYIFSIFTCILCWNQEILHIYFKQLGKKTPTLKYFISKIIKITFYLLFFKYMLAKKWGAF